MTNVQKLIERFDRHESQTTRKLYVTHAELAALESAGARVKRGPQHGGGTVADAYYEGRVFVHVCSSGVSSCTTVH